MFLYKCALYYLCLVSVGDVFMYKCLQLFWCVCQVLGGHWELWHVWCNNRRVFVIQTACSALWLTVAGPEVRTCIITGIRCAVKSTRGIRLCPSNKKIVFYSLHFLFCSKAILSQLMKDKTILTSFLSSVRVDQVV